MSFPPEHEIFRRRFGRNLGLGLTLAAFVLLVFGLTVVKVTQVGHLIAAEKAAAAAAGKAP
jgi:hypothetical protein